MYVLCAVPRNFGNVFITAMMQLVENNAVCMFFQLNTKYDHLVLSKILNLPKT